MGNLSRNISRLHCTGFSGATATLQGCCLLMLLVAGFGAGKAGAQNYPTRPIHIKTTSAGGGIDIVARLVAAEISTSVGQPVVIENRPGTLLATEVARSAPDGHTLLIWGGGLWLSSLLNNEKDFDAIRDFAPIVTLTRTPNILMVHPSLPAQSVADLIKLAKARPGELNYSSGPTGTSSHLAGELFKSLANVNVLRIAYKTQSQHTADFLSGRIQMSFGSGSGWGPQVKAGKLRALATGGSGKSVLFPDLPTVAETLPGFVSESLVGFWAPAKTPNAVVRRLTQEAISAIEKPSVRERLMGDGGEPVGGTPEQLTDMMKSDIARVSKMIKDGVIKPGGE